MCATCVYLNFDHDLDLDDYFTRLSEAYEAIRVDDQVFCIRWSQNEAVDLHYDEELSMIILGDEFNDSTTEERQFIRPAQLVPLIDWHVELYSLDPDHVLGYSNHFYSEFQQIYLRKPIRYSHFTPFANGRSKG